MDDPLIQSLLFRGEGQDLDFKSEHYRISGATEEQKSEVVKDIIAMTNAWRVGNAYILLGFKENRPGPAVVTGITESVDDATIQQLVHSKSARPISFSYDVRSYGGKTVAVITIPKQQRPAFLRRNFGKLRANIVYVRRGSSTGEADPAEIAEMVKHDGAAPRAAAIELIAVTPITHEPLRETQTRTSLKFDVDISDLPDFAARPDPTGNNDPERAAQVRDRVANIEYWRELARWAQGRSFPIVLKFSITNNSAFPLSDSKLEIQVRPHDKASMWHGTDLATESSPWKFGIRSERPDPPESMSFESRGNTELCKVRVPKVLPGERYITPESLAVWTDKWSGKFSLEMRLLAHELSEPITIVKPFYVRLKEKHLAGVDALEKYAWGLESGRKRGHR